MNRLSNSIVPIAGLVLAWMPACTVVESGPRFRPLRQAHGLAARDVTHLREDPVAFLQATLQRSRRLHQYELTFLRRERLGLLIKALQPLERMRVKFRDEPFSVRFVWLDESSPYAESLYVQGANNDRLLVRERKGLLGGPPAIRAYDVRDPVRWQKAKNLVTDFGLTRMLERTLAKLREAEAAGGAEVQYQGLVHLDLIDRDVHHIQIHYPAAKGFAHRKQDLFIDAATGLPAGSYLWLPDGQLDAMYLYTDVDTSVQFSDQDFTMTSRPAS